MRFSMSIYNKIDFQQVKNRIANAEIYQMVIIMQRYTFRLFIDHFSK